MKNLPRMLLQAGEHKIDAYVARGHEERELGLMHRQSLQENEGMLFVCAQPRPQSFWMKDTPLALSIAFVDDDGTIVELSDMAPLSTDSCGCETPVRFVLEMNQGWFEERGIACGTRLSGPAFITT